MKLRKLIAVFATLLMLVGMLPLSMAVSAADIGTYDFEDGAIPAGWQLTTDGASCVSTAAAKDGKYGFKISGAAWAEILTTSSFELKDGVTYTIAFDIKAASASGRFNFQIKNPSVPEKPGAGSNMVMEYRNISTSWTTLTYTVAKDATYPNGYFSMLFVSQGVDFYIDNIAITDDTAGDEVEGEDLITNGDFENGDANWTKLVNTIGVVDDPTNSGHGKVMKTDEGGGSIHMFQQDIPNLTPNTDYVLKFKVYTYAASGTKPGFWATLGTNVITYNTSDVTCFPMEVKTVDSSSSTRVRFTSVLESAYNEWIDVEIPFNSNNATSTTIVFSNYRAGAGQYYFDDIVLCATGATPEEPPSTAGDLENGSFETGDATGWRTWQSTKISQDAAHDGKYGANLKGDGGWGGMLDQSVAVEKGSEYTLSFWLKINAVGVNVQIKQNDNSGAQIDGGWYKIELYGDWTLVTYQFVAPCNTVYINFCGSGKGIAEDAYVDNFKCVKNETVNTALIKNGGFDTGSLSGWKNLWDGCNVSFVEGYNSKYALKLECGQWNQVRQDGIAVEPFADYVYSAYVKNAKNFTLMIKKGDDSGNIASVATSTTSEWTKFEVAFNAGTETTVCALLMGNSDGCSALIDDVTLTKVAGGDEGRNELLIDGGSSIRDTASFKRGLAFRFSLNVSGAQVIDNHKLVQGTGSLDLFKENDDIGTLIETGAIVTNQEKLGNSNMTISDVDGKKTVKVAAQYVMDANDTSISYAVRIINIPDKHTGTRIYARPYYTYELNGEQVTVYGNIYSNTYDAISGASTSLKILAIGNSFSVDAMNNHLYDVLKSAGYDEVVLGNLYVGGCSLDQHWNYIQNNQKAYTFYKNNNNGKWGAPSGYDVLTALKSEEWDVITVQQASPTSGQPESYKNLQNLVNWIEQNKTNPNAKIYWHMTWAYQQDSTHSAFPNYGRDQMTMYNAIVDATQNTAMKVENIDGLIPAGTAIQNLRTSGLGDTLTSDGHHLLDTYGDYTASLTWFAAITGKSLDLVDYIPTSIADHHFDIARAVAHAVYAPYAIHDLAETVLVAGSDFQPTGYDTTVIRGLLGSLMKQGYGLFDGALIVGDYTPANGHDESSKGLAVLDEVLSQNVNFGKIYSQGNHDVNTTIGMCPYGNNDPLNAPYGVFAINEDNYDAHGTGGQKVAADLTAYFNEKLANGWGNKPIFVMSHLPLHYNYRTVKDKAATSAMYILNALNSASDAGLNIIFLIAHNHSGGYDDYLGGGAIYIPKGDSILVPDPNGYKNAPIETEIRFTYLNAGYIAYYADMGMGADTALTMTTFRIQEDGSVIITRYDMSGVHNLKSAGKLSPSDPEYTTYTYADGRVYTSSRIVSAGVDEPYAE
ncbi:MAG: DUF4886 domain-containing protein [Clostridia bacterium]|nr:DUF4886 domain-containing protein [Clostridia bacterium]